MSSAEFVEWQAYHQIEPFGEERADLRAGIVAATVANRGRSKKDKVFKPKDFMPRFDQPRGPMTAEQMLKTAEAWNAFLGGKDLRTKKRAP